MASFFRNSLLFTVTFIITLALISPKACGQGEFLHKGNSGVALDGFYVEGKKNLYVENSGIAEQKTASMSGTGGKFGFSIKGIFDLQLAVHAWSVPSTSLYPDSKGTTVSTRLVVHAVKQSDKFPFSVRGIFSYGYSNYDEIPTSDTDLEFGVGVSRRLYIRDNISIIPTMDLLYSLSNYTFLDSSTTDVSEGEAIYVISLPIAINLFRNHLIHLSPHIYYGMSSSTGYFGFNLGYIIPFYLGSR